MQKKNRFLSAFYGAFGVAMLVGAPLSVKADMGEYPSKPLIVIRFNQAHVYYDQQLYSAISQAVAAKPQVMFDVVSSAPSTGNSQTDAQWVATASHNTQAVVATLRSIGVPMERMRVTGQAEAGLHYDETKIYVR